MWRPFVQFSALLTGLAISWFAGLLGNFYYLAQYADPEKGQSAHLCIFSALAVICLGFYLWRRDEIY